MYAGIIEASGFRVKPSGNGFGPPMGKAPKPNNDKGGAT
jgi:hypothetical protein